MNGTASTWTDRGFGFITVADGGEDAFCHGSSITDGNALREGDPVTFVSTVDPRGKRRAENVTGGVTLPPAASVETAAVQLRKIARQKADGSAAIATIAAGAPRVALELLSEPGGQGPLHLAAWKGHLENTRALLQLNADIDAVSTGEYNYGKSALFYAITQDRDQVVRMLLEHGASVKVVNNKGQSVASLAASHLKPETCALIAVAEARQSDVEWKNYRATHSDGMKYGDQDPRHVNDDGAAIEPPLPGPLPDATIRPSTKQNRRGNFGRNNPGVENQGLPSWSTRAKKNKTKRKDAAVAPDQNERYEALPPWSSVVAVLEMAVAETVGGTAGLAALADAALACAEWMVAGGAGRCGAAPQTPSPSIDEVIAASLSDGSERAVRRAEATLSIAISPPPSKGHPRSVLRAALGKALARAPAGLLKAQATRVLSTHGLRGMLEAYRLAPACVGLPPASALQETLGKLGAAGQYKEILKALDVLGEPAARAAEAATTLHRLTAAVSGGIPLEALVRLGTHVVSWRPGVIFELASAGDVDSAVQGAWRSAIKWGISLHTLCTESTAAGSTAAMKQLIRNLEVRTLAKLQSEGSCRAAREYAENDRELEAMLLPVERPPLAPLSLSDEPLWVPPDIDRIAMVDSHAGLAKLRAALETVQSATVALDCEWRHPRPLSLVQIAFGGRAGDDVPAVQVFVLDMVTGPPSFAATVRGLLRTMLEDVSIQIIGFGLKADLPRINMALGPPAVNVANLTELQPRGLDGASDMALTTVVTRSLGVRLDKSAQCSNWDRRPLRDEQVRYAAGDAVVLLELARVNAASSSTALLAVEVEALATRLAAVRDRLAAAERARISRGSGA